MRPCHAPSFFRVEIIYIYSVERHEKKKHRWGLAEDGGGGGRAGFVELVSIESIEEILAVPIIVLSFVRYTVIVWRALCRIAIRILS